MNLPQPVNRLRGVTMYRGRAVLHCTKTNLYYVAPNQWTADPKQARDFEQVHDATRIDREQQMTDMEVVLRYHDPSCDLVLPLRKP